MPKHEHLPLRQRQPLDQAQELVVAQPPEPGNGLGVLEAVVEQSLNLGRRAHVRPAQATEPIENVVARDPEDPGAERGVADLVGRERDQHPQEDLVGGVLGLVVIVQRDDHVPIQGRQVQVVEVVERLGVAALKPAHEGQRGLLPPALVRKRDHPHISKNARGSRNVSRI